MEKIEIIQEKASRKCKSTYMLFRSGGKSRIINNSTKRIIPNDSVTGKRILNLSHGFKKEEDA